jgi:hypothetical protein
MTERLASAAARHPGRTVAAWIAAVLVAVALSALFLGDALTGEAEQLNNPESEQAYSLLADRLPPISDGEFTTDVVLVRSDSVTTDQAAFQQKLDELVDSLRSIPGVLSVADEPAAQNQRAALIQVGLSDEVAAENVVEALRAEDNESFALYVTGEWFAL